MGNAAEKFPLPGLPPEHKPEEVTSDMIVSEENLPANDETPITPDMVVSEETLPVKDEVAESLEILKDIHEAREIEKTRVDEVTALEAADKEASNKEIEQVADATVTKADREKAKDEEKSKKWREEEENTQKQIAEARTELRKGRENKANQERDKRIEDLGKRVDADMADKDLFEKEVQERDAEIRFEMGEDALQPQPPFNLDIEKGTYAPDGALAIELRSLQTSGAFPEKFDVNAYLTAEARYENARKTYDNSMSKGFFSRLKNRKNIKLAKAYMNAASPTASEGRSLLLEARKGTPEAKVEAPTVQTEENKALANLEGRDAPEDFHKNSYIDTAHLVDLLHKEITDEASGSLKETRSIKKKRKELKSALKKLEAFESKLK